MFHWAILAGHFSSPIGVEWVDQIIICLKQFYNQYITHVSIAVVYRSVDFIAAKIPSFIRFDESWILVRDNCLTYLDLSASIHPSSSSWLHGKNSPNHWFTLHVWLHKSFKLWRLLNINYFINHLPDVWGMMTIWVWAVCQPGHEDNRLPWNIQFASCSLYVNLLIKYIWSLFLS